MLKNKVITNYFKNRKEETTTTKPYPTKWGRLYESNDAIVFNFYHMSYKCTWNRFSVTRLYGLHESNLEVFDHMVENRNLPE